MVLALAVFVFNILSDVFSQEELFLKDYNVISLNTTEGIVYPGLQYNYTLQDDSKTTYNSHQAWVFFNIPYVRPIIPGKEFSTTEELSKEEYKKLVLQREYTKFGHYCPQYLDDVNYEQSMSMDLDCLNLNVFVPPIKKNKFYPVYVLIHGGRLVHGSFLDLGIDGLIQNFVSKGIVIVTPNYRIGIWGYYNFKGKQKGHSARGLYDKLEALKWVHNNIKDFGGNSQQVTVGGYSAGACAVAVLTMVALANPEYQLFNNIILHSGFTNTCITGGVFNQNYEEKLLRSLNCTLENQEDCFKQKTIDQILKATKETAMFGIQYDVPDGIFKSRKEMLDDASKSQRKQTLNILMGTVLHEFINFNPQILKLTNKPYGRAFVREGLSRLVLIGTSTNNILSLILDKQKEKINVLNEKMMTTLEKLLDIYFRSFDEDELDEEGNFRVCTKMFKDYWMTRNLVNDAKFFAKTGHKVTIYKFVHIGPLPSKYKHTTPLKEKVVPHGTDVFYAYMPRNNWQSMLGMSAEAVNSEKFASRNLARELSHFIQTGATATPSSAFDPQRLNYLLIDNSTVVKSDRPIIELEALKLWQELAETIQEIYALDTFNPNL